MASFPADPTPLTSGNTRVKNARKLARRSFRAEERLFLADGPTQMRGTAEGVDDKGRLRVRGPDGGVQAFASGSVRLA